MRIRSFLKKIKNKINLLNSAFRENITFQTLEISQKLGSFFKDRGYFNLDLLNSTFRENITFQTLETSQKLGSFFKDRGYFNLAVRCYKKAIEIDPGLLEDLYFSLKQSLAKRRKFSQYYLLFELMKEANLHPLADIKEEINWDRFEQLLHQGNSWVKRGDYQEAIEAYNQAIALWPKSFEEFIFFLGNEPDKGEVLIGLLKWLEVSQELINPDSHLFLAQALTKQQKICEAIGCYYRAIYFGNDEKLTEQDLEQVLANYLTAGSHR